MAEKLDLDELEKAYETKADHPDFALNMLKAMHSFPALIARIRELETELERASQPGSEPPLAWFEAEESCRGADLRSIVNGMMHSTRWHWQAERPQTNNPVWPIYAGSQPGSGEATQDASRYRWLRETAIRCQAYVHGKPNWLFGFELRGTTFDEAIDAARASLDGRREGHE